MNHYPYEEKNGFIELSLPDIEEPVRILLPPNEFPEHMFLLNEEKKVKQTLKAFEIKAPEINLEGLNYLGVCVQKGKYHPFLYKIPYVNNINPVATEKGNDTIVQYLNENGVYYRVCAEPLRDISSGKVANIKERLIDHLKKIQCFLHYGDWIKRYIPIGLYKGYAPIIYFAETLGFNEYYVDTNEIIVEGNSNRGKRLRTFHEFMYYMNTKNRKTKNKVMIYDENILGKKVPLYHRNEKVRVTNIKGEKEGLNGITGKVLHISGLEVQVEFFGYFRTSFSPYELEKAE
jgi:hypothetical protein